MSPTVLIAVLVFLGVFVPAGVFVTWRYLVLRRNNRGRARRGVLLQLKPSLELKLSPTEQKQKMVMILQQFVRYISDWRERITETEAAYSLEIHATGMDERGRGGYGFYVWVPEEEAKLMATTVGAKYELPYVVKPEDEPMARYAQKLADERGYPKYDGFYTGEYRLSSPYYLPINEWLPGKEPDDPTEAFYGIFDAFRARNGVAGLIVTMKPADSNWRERGMAFLRSREYGVTTPGTPMERLRSMGEEEQKPQRQQLDTFDKDELAAVTGKLKQDAFEAVVRIYSTDWETYSLLKDTVERRFRSETNGIVLKEMPVSLQDMAARWFDRSDMVLSLGEIASILHLPDSETKAGRLQRGASKSAMPPEGLPTIREASRTDIFHLLDSIGVEES